MNYTFATVIIPYGYQEMAQGDLGPGFFNTLLSSDGAYPPSNLMSSGPFDNAELDAIVNTYTWPKKVYFGDDWQSALSAEGLQLVQEPQAAVEQTPAD